MRRVTLTVFALSAFLLNCNGGGASIEDRLAMYTPVRLTSDLSVLTDSERAMLPLLIEAAQTMHGAFWEQAYGDKDALLATIDDESTRRLIEINYGPWDRLAGDEPFVPGIGPKPAGANLYPADMTAAEFEKALEQPTGRADALKSLYTVVRRTPEGALITVPYSQAYSDAYQRAAAKLRQAAELAEDAGLRRYLTLRAEALLTDQYRESDLAWMDMKTNRLDIVIGPIESYEDKLFGYKASNEAYVLIKDLAWSERLSRYGALLPGLQRGLPVPEVYKRETPGSESDLNAYDAVYYAGDCNAGAKTIAINLPNDETVQLEKGARRLQLKNTMRAKFDKILVPIADMLIDTEQRKNITFDAFFANSMFHEVAHGLGIKNTIDGNGTVRAALKEQSSYLEEGKADILGLYMITALTERGELDATALADNYITFMTSIFRSIRFGASSAHGIANAVRFNFFEEHGAFVRDQSSGRYTVNMDRMGEAMTALSEKILRLQGDGDYAGVVEFRARYGSITVQLQADLDRLGNAGVPVDVVFEQGVDVLGL